MLSPGRRVGDVLPSAKATTCMDSVYREDKLPLKKLISFQGLFFHLTISTNFYFGLALGVIFPQFFLLLPIFFDSFSHFPHVRAITF